jgi:hypothetical protein
MLFLLICCSWSVYFSDSFIVIVSVCVICSVTVSVNISDSFSDILIVIVNPLRSSLAVCSS